MSKKCFKFFFKISLSIELEYLLLSIVSTDHPIDHIGLSPKIPIKAIHNFNTL